MSGNGIQIRLGDMLQIIWKRRLMISLLTAAGLILGIMLYGISYLQGEMSKEYTITASAAVVTKTAGGQYSSGFANPNQDDIRLAKEMVETVIYTMKSKRTLDEVIDKQGLVGITAKDLEKNLSAQRYEDSEIIEMSLLWGNVEEGSKIIQAVVDTTENVLQQTLRIGTLEMINAPSSSSWSLGAKIGMSSWIFMAVLGFIIGVGIALLELIMRPTLMNLNDVENVLGLEKIAVVPGNEEVFRTKNVFLSGETEKLAEFRNNYVAAARILYNRLGKKNSCKCFYVTSATAGEGKTTTAANLAIQLSDMEHKVLLIDLDTRNPGLGGLFIEQIDYNHSLNALYRGDVSLEDAITPLTGYLDLMPAVLEHNAISFDNTIFDMIKKLSADYEFIIIDTAPVGVYAEVLNLNQVADVAVYVVRYDYASMQSVREALTTMDKSGIRVIGCIVNDAKHISRNEAFSRQKPKEKPSEENKIWDMEAQPSVPNRSKQYKSIMDEDFEDVNPDWESERSDDDTMDALLKMGMSGSWKEKETETETEDAAESQEMQKEEETEKE